MKITKKKEWIGALIITLAVLIFAAGISIKNNKMFIASTDLTSVKINGIEIDTTKTNKVEGKNLKVTKDDIENILGENYSNRLYNYSQCFYKMTYYDKENDASINFVYFNKREKPIEWVYVIKK